MAIKKSVLYSSLWASCNELRYATPLPQLEREVATLAARVQEHLKRMGATWN